jgi:hypothetical protein
LVTERQVALPPLVFRERVMATLSYTCPRTQRRASTGINADVESLRASWSKTLRIHCSLCGEVHELSVRETYTDGILRDACDAFRRA